MDVADSKGLALDVMTQLEHSRGFSELAPGERARLRTDLRKIGGALREEERDAYDLALETPLDLQRKLANRSGSERPPVRPSAVGPGAVRQPAGKARPDATQALGDRVSDTLEAIDFPAFVAGLVTGTFQAIVDATGQQVREYAQLVASISQSVEDFSRGNVSAFQVREWLVERHGEDIALKLPAPGTNQQARLVPRRENASPAWLKEYGLDGEVLDAKLANSVLVDRARNSLGEERLQALSTMVLMGINRVVVKEGHIRAKLQFHAGARDRRQAEVKSLSANQGKGVAGRQVSMSMASQTQVSTIKANTQSDTNIKADLMGEVQLVFATETFPLADFADTPAIQLIQRNARWKGDPQGVPAPNAAPIAAPTNDGGN